MMLKSKLFERAKPQWELAANVIPSNLVNSFHVSFTSPQYDRNVQLTERTHFGTPVAAVAKPTSIENRTLYGGTI